jgi:hypothetical protein
MLETTLNRGQGATNFMKERVNVNIGVTKVRCPHNICQDCRSQSLIDVIITCIDGNKITDSVVVELQSLSEVVGAHVVLDCKWIITDFYTHYHSPPPPPPPHPNRCCFNQNISNLTRNGTQHCTRGEIDVC